MKVSYHEAKRAKTLLERGLDFADAGVVFDDTHLIIPDDRRDYGEERYQTIGHLGPAIVMVVWTPRGDARHIISMRKCNDAEKQFLREHLDRSG